MNKFDQSVMNYCKTHPEDPLSEYFLKVFAQSAERRKHEKQKWKLISTALLEMSKA